MHIEAVRMKDCGQIVKENAQLLYDAQHKYTILVCFVMFG